MSWVKDVTYSARTFGADEALRQGFVSKVLPSKSDAVTEGLKMATLLAEKSPVAVQGTKAVVNYSQDHTIQAGMCSKKSRLDG
jgi:delta(3,5)-delta(2,4)-dienoyl-CoA isomerase